MSSKQPDVDKLTKGDRRRGTSVSESASQIPVLKASPSGRHTPIRTPRSEVTDSIEIYIVHVHILQKIQKFWHTMQYLDQTSLREMSIFRPSKVRSHRQVHECSSTMENVLSVLALLHIKYFKPSIMKRKMTGFFSSMWYPWKTYTYNDKYNIFFWDIQEGHQWKEDP